MISDGVALIAHDLKNALGWLEHDLAKLIKDPNPRLAHEAHAHCVALQRRFVHFLTLYSAKDGLTAHSQDESPLTLLENLQTNPTWAVQMPQIQLMVGPCADAPLYWYFDHQLVHMAMESAVHNAARFARQAITLDATVRDGELVLSVEDDGPGLGSQAPSKHSTGLGTALCEAVAQAHHCGARQGQVRLFNGPQGGTRFELCLP